MFDLGFYSVIELSSSLVQCVLCSCFAKLRKRITFYFNIEHELQIRILVLVL